MTKGRSVWSHGGDRGATGKSKSKTSSSSSSSSSQRRGSKTKPNHTTATTTATTSATTSATAAPRSTSPRSTSPRSTSPRSTSPKTVPAQKKPKDKRKWAIVASDPIAGITTTSEGMVIGDITEGGDNKVVIANFNEKGSSTVLKVFSLGLLEQTTTVAGTPSGMVAIQQDQDKKSHLLGVASAGGLYVFKNLRPFYKFLLPELPINEEERALWTKARTDENPDVQGFEASLLALRKRGVHLSDQSLEFLGIGKTLRQAFIAQAKDLPATRTSIIVSLKTLPQYNTDGTGVTLPVVGTEDGQVYILRASNFGALVQAQVEGSIACMCTVGAFETEYRIIVATRECKVFTIKGGEVQSDVFTLPAPPIGIDRVRKCLLVACADKTLYCYSSKGRLLWQRVQADTITTLIPFAYYPKMLRGSMIGLGNGEVRLYDDKDLLDVIQMDGPVAAIEFGRVYKNSYNLLCITSTGRYSAYQLRRGVDFRAIPSQQGPPSEQLQRINVPAKTKLYVDQTEREKQNAIAMHHTFRRDLFMLHNLLARHYFKALVTALVPTGKLDDISLHVDAGAQGIGPMFQLSITVRNTGPATIINLRVCLSWDLDIYSIPEARKPIPRLTSGAQSTVTFDVKCITEEMISKPIQARVFTSARTLPIVTAIVNMPISEPVVTIR